MDAARRLLEQERAGEAARVMRHYLTRHSGTASEYVLLGVALAQAGEGLAAMQPLEQAVAMEPGCASAHFNLGQVYRQGGRQREALAEFERALHLRPNYPAAARAADEVRRCLAGGPLPEEMRPAASRPATCPAAYDIPATARPAARARPRSSPWRGVLAAAWQLTVSPVAAVNGGLDTFFNTPGAVGTVVSFFLTAVAVSVLGDWLSGFGSDLGPTDPSQMLSAIAMMIVVQVIVITGMITVYNKITIWRGWIGGSDDFIAEFGSLAMSFAMIVSTVALVTTPLSVILSLGGGSDAAVAVTVVRWLWTLMLEVMLVVAAADIGATKAWFLLIGANILSHVVGVIVGAAIGLV